MAFHLGWAERNLTVPMPGNPGAIGPVALSGSLSLSRPNEPSAPSHASSRHSKRPKRAPTKSPFRTRYGVDWIGEFALTTADITPPHSWAEVLSERALLELAVMALVRRRDVRMYVGASRGIYWTT